MVHLTRDQRLLIRSHRDRGDTLRTIRQNTGFTLNQIQYACRDDVNLTPQKNKSGHPTRITAAHLDQIIEWIRSSLQNRIYTCEKKVEILELPICGDTLRRMLKKRGMKAHPGAQKPAITPAHAARRLQWAHEHINWPLDQWKRVIYSDEVWFQSGWHRMPYVHRFDDERYHPTAVIPQSGQRSGIMVWSCFCGDIKGPIVIWDPNWGSIGSATYVEHILPVIDAFNVKLWEDYSIDAIYMQDGASAHTAYHTTQELYDIDVNIEDYWHPSRSPDLNPQENVWNVWKDDVSKQCGPKDIPRSRHHELIAMIRQAWDRIPDSYFESLTRSMPRRCAEVIEKGGAATKY
jgi:transposase/predicted SAM-dependent methyltransferase